MQSSHLEINFMVIKAQSGDKAAINKILSYFEDKIKKISKSFFILGAEHEDVVQIARIGLWDAIKTYDPERKVNFEYFAQRCIRGHIISAFQEARKKRNDPLNFGESLDAPINIFEENGATAYDIQNNEESANVDLKVSAQDEINWLDTALKKRLTKLEKDSYEKYKQGNSYREIASQLAKTEKTIDNALMRVRTKAEHVVKQYLENIKENEEKLCSDELARKWGLK